jgi:hypothetical protein
MTHTFTTADADRLLGLADQFLEDWAENAIQSGAPDEEYEERHAEWQAIRPLLVAAPDLLKAAQQGLDELQVWGETAKDDEATHEAISALTAAIANAKGGTPVPKPSCADCAAWAEKAVTAYARAKEGRAYDPLEEMASDLFADLCHLCVREGVSPELMMERAQRHCQEACLEEGIVL